MWVKGHGRRRRLGAKVTLGFTLGFTLDFSGKSRQTQLVSALRMQGSFYSQMPDLKRKDVPCASAM